MNSTLEGSELRSVVVDTEPCSMSGEERERLDFARTESDLVIEVCNLNRLFMQGARNRHLVKSVAKINKLTAAFLAKAPST